jgi:hypothetical protein
MTIRQTTISSLVVAALSLGVAGGVALAAEDSPPSQSPGAPTSGHPSVLTETECSGVWKDAASGSDVLTGDKAGGYVTDFKQADADQDGNISQAEFSEACKKGLIKPEHAESAKMGKDVGTHPGTVGEKPELDTSKTVQPPRKSPTTGGDNN